MANLVASCLSLDEVSLLAAILVELSDTLNTIVAHRTLCGEEGAADAKDAEHEKP